MKKIHMKSFILGICAALMFTSIISVSAQNIDVIMSGIKIYWDGEEKTLADANGKKVEPMIYEGTTYVPLRAMSNLMGKEVDWNQADMAVYVGKKPTMRTIPLADMEKNINGYSYYQKKCSFYLKNEQIKITNGCIDYCRGNSITYVLDGKFAKFTGKMVMPYRTVGEEGNAIITFYSVENDGTANKIKSYNLKKTDDPINVDVNLTGVTNLTIKYEQEGSTSDEVVIYDASFLGE